MKRKLALFLAVLLAITQLGSYLPAMAATSSKALNSSEPTYMAKLLGTYVDGDGKTQQWKEVYQSVSVTPGKTYEFSFDYYSSEETYTLTARILNGATWGVLTSNATSVTGERKTMTLTYTAQTGETQLVPLLIMGDKGSVYVWNMRFKEEGQDTNLLKNPDFTEGDGTWIGWSIAGSGASDKTGSDNLTAKYGHAIVPYDKSLLGLEPSYMAKLIGTYIDGDGQVQQWKEVYQSVSVTSGKTYEFSFDYYSSDEKYTLTARIKNNSWQDQVSASSVAGEIKTMTLTYTAEAGDTQLIPLLSKGDQGTVYVWNMSFKEVGQDTNLLKNPNFTEEDGTWIGWSIAGSGVATKADSEKMTKAYGHAIVPYDESLFVQESTGQIPTGDPEYMIKMIGTYTDSAGVEQTYKEISQGLAVTPGKTYEFTYSYYVPVGGNLEGRIVDGNWDILDSTSFVEGEIATAKISYTAQAGDTFITPLLAKNTQGIAYVWNLCFREAESNTNLFYNADFTEEDGTFIGWSIGGTKVTTLKGSEDITKAYGHAIVSYDKSLFVQESAGQIPTGDPEYMIKMIGTYTDSAGVKQEYKEIYQSVAVTPGKTYEFTYSYYVPVGGNLEGRILDSNWKKLATTSFVVGKVSTAKITYTAKAGENSLIPLLAKNTQGLAYVWNLCFREVGSDINLLSNADFTEEDGTFIGWSIGGKAIGTKADSENIIKAYGHTIVPYDESLFVLKSSEQVPTGNSKYMIKMIGTYTDSAGVKQEYKEIYQSIAVTPGKTYEFTYSYYVPVGGNLEGRILDNNWNKLATVSFVPGEIATAKVTYTAKAGDNSVIPLLAKNTQGIAYVWNLCFREVGSNINLLSNADFTEENGTFIGWSIGGKAIGTKTDSENIIKAYGHTIVPYDESLFVLDSSAQIPTGDPEYMVKMIGTYVDSDGNTQMWKELYQIMTVTAGKTYEFSFNYVVPGEGALTGRLLKADWTIIESVKSETGAVGTITIRYTAKENENVLPMVMKDASGYAYVWNMCFREVGKNINLLYNADFTEENGTFIGWSMGGKGAGTKADSDKLTEAFGHQIVKFDRELFVKEKGNASNLNSPINPNYYFSFDDNGKYKTLDTWPRNASAGDGAVSSIILNNRKKMLAVCIGGVAVLALTATGVTILVLKKKKDKSEIKN